MSIYKFLELQPIDPQEDGTISELDMFEQDEVFNLSEETEGDDIIQAWETLERDMRRRSRAR